MVWSIYNANFKFQAKHKQFFLCFLSATMETAVLAQALLTTPDLERPLKAWAKYSHSLLNCSRSPESLTNTESEYETSGSDCCSHPWEAWDLVCRENLEKQGLCKLEKLQDALSRAGGLIQEELWGTEMWMGRREVSTEDQAVGTK